MKTTAEILLDRACVLFGCETKNTVAVLEQIVRESNNRQRLKMAVRSAIGSLEVASEAFDLSIPAEVESPPASPEPHQPKEIQAARQATEFRRAKLLRSSPPRTECPGCFVAIYGEAAERGWCADCEPRTASPEPGEQVTGEFQPFTIEELRKEYHGNSTKISAEAMPDAGIRRVANTVAARVRSERHKPLPPIPLEDAAKKLADVVEKELPYNNDLSSRKHAERIALAVASLAREMLGGGK